MGEASARSRERPDLTRWQADRPVPSDPLASLEDPARPIFEHHVRSAPLHLDPSIAVDLGA